MSGDARLLLKVLNVLQGAHYIDRMEHLPSQETFARGWFTRVSLHQAGGRHRDFADVFQRTMHHEGGYSNNPDDLGGETYKGISRVYHPSWIGWAIVDGWKAKHLQAPENRDEGWLQNNERMQRYVREFYKAQFWDTWRGDDVLEIDGAVAAEVFDTGVNMGVQKAVYYLQRALNVLNREGESWLDLEEDGLMGSRTLTALMACCL
ncbi:MAG: glycosyl hydrolase 108 family protein [Nannocystaceae bacterium]